VKQHGIAFTISPHGWNNVEWEIACHAPDGSSCNTFCHEESCAEVGINPEPDGKGGFGHEFEWDDGENVTEVWHTAHVDGCTIADWMGNGDGALACYAGETTTLRDGLIDLTWDDDHWTWAYDALAATEGGGL
jgi:hypothetical protein